MPRRKKYVQPHTTLTPLQRRLLEYPPTEGTWLCVAKKEYGKCGMPNSGKAPSCTWCATERPKRPKLLWPEYIIACNKVGIKPLSAVWRKSPSTGQLMIRLNGERWTEWEIPEAPVESITRTRAGKTRTRSRSGSKK